MKLSLLFTLAVLLSFDTLAYDFSGDKITLGLKTYHFNRSGRDCFNETHDLFGYQHNGYNVATYINTQCERSYVLGKNWDYSHGFGSSLNLVSGYPKAMQIMHKVVLMPTLTYTKWSGRVGVRLMTVPTVLVGASLMVRIP